MAPAHSSSAKRGAALITVLWLSLLLSAFLAIAVVAGRTEIRLAAEARETFRAERASRAAMDWAAMIHSVKGVDAPETIRESQFQWDGYDVEIGIVDESTKVDINLASETVLAAYFGYLGAELEDAQAWASAIADWRDTDDLSRVNGAEASDYRAARVDFAPQNRPFLDLYELETVIGLEKDFIECARAGMTIHGSARALGVVDFSRFAPGAARARDPNLESEDTPRRLIAETNASVAGRKFRITATTKRRTSGEAKLSGIVLITGERQKPYRWIQMGAAPQRPDCAHDDPSPAQSG